MPELLSYDRTVELLREVIAEKGEDFVYRDASQLGADCFYVLNGQPSCLVGHVFARAGFPLDDMADIEEDGPIGVMDADLFAEWADDDSLGLLDLVQAQQDHGKTWGEALRAGLAAGEPGE